MNDFFKVASLVLAITTIILLTSNQSLKTQYLDQLESSYWDKSVIDSLHTELFVMELELVSYRERWSRLAEADSALATEIESQVEFR